jgi:hypothetical protein
MPIFQYSAKTGYLEVFHHVGTNFYSFFVNSRLVSKSGSLLVIFSLLHRWLGFASGALIEETLSFVIPAGRVKVILDNGYKLTLQEKQLAVGTGHEILVQLHRLVNRIGKYSDLPKQESLAELAKTG